MFGPWSLTTFAPLLVALAAGAVVPFQAASNAALGRSLGHPLWATLTSLTVSVLVIVPVMMAMRVPTPTFGPALQGPAWLWLGGVAGVAYITAALVLTPKLGAAGFIVAVVAGQMLASLLIDHLGLMGLPAKPANAMRLLGVAVILVGMLLVQFSQAGTVTPAHPPAVAAERR